jgi:hypothetical protein
MAWLVSWESTVFSNLLGSWPIVSLLDNEDHDELTQGHLLGKVSLLARFERFGPQLHNCYARKLIDAFKAGMLQEEVIIAYSKIPYRRRLPDEEVEHRIERALWAAVQAHLVSERWYAASETFRRTGSDPRQLRCMNRARETAG